jgi:signal transduction histidine kinase/CheY-like chemotaxis protein
MPATPHAPPLQPDGSGPARQTSPVRQGELDVFYDIARLLDAADDSDGRVQRVLARFGALVPHERCAVLEAMPGREPRLISSPETPPAARAQLEVKMLALLEGLAFDGPRAEGPSAGMHVAVPLIVLDNVVGVLLVERAADAYEEQHVRAAAVVAAQLAAYFSMLHALTREQQRAVELSEARRAAEAADRAKDEFLALVSHELRTPLNSILTWTDALRSKETSEQDRTRAVETIERAVRGHAKLVADLLDLSCIAAAALRLDLSAVKPADLIKQAISALEPQAKQKAIKLDVVLDESVTPLVVDPRRLSQVVVNLVTNAIEFTPPGGHVEVRLEQDDALARIRVIDTGPGIRPEVLPRLFEPFAQFDSSTTRAHGGLGLGLALVKDLVELHGGQVRAESAGERTGAIFTVELPLGGAVRRDSQPPGAARDSSRPKQALAGIRVLLVDDDQDIGEILQLVLESQGAIVSVVHSAVEALASLTLSMPNVLLSDLSMPGGSGYDLMRSIVAREGKNAPPAAAISACAPGQSLRKALDSGFRMLLEKPIDHPALIAAVATLARDARHDPGAGGASKAGFIG